MLYSACAWTQLPVICTGLIIAISGDETVVRRVRKVT